MGYADVDMLLEGFEDGLLHVTLNRPERRNALSLELSRLLVSALRRARVDPAVRAVLLSGSGKAFCVGGDIQDIAECGKQAATMETQSAELLSATEASLLLHEMPKPTVAALHGGVAGAGLSLALACDIRIASDDAKLTPSFSKIGLSGDFGGSYFLSKLLGPRARYFSMLSPVLLAEEARQWGLVDEVVPCSERLGRATAVARSLAGGPTIALGYIKENLNFAARGNSLADVLQHEALRQIRCALTDDHAEGAAAFFEKRPPIFRNR